MYSLLTIYHNHNPELNAKLEEVIGKRATGSGMRLSDGLADASWAFSRLSDAKRAMRTAKRIHEVEMLAILRNDRIIITWSRPSK